MSGLMELGPMTKDILVMGKPLTIRPITTGQLIELFDKFPMLIELLGGGGQENSDSTIGMLALAHVIATSTGEANNPEAIEVAQMLGAGKVAEIIEQIIEITFEDGTGPFIQRIKRATKDMTPTGDSSLASSVPWSASLTGDEPKKTRLPLRRVR